MPRTFARASWSALFASLLAAAYGCGSGSADGTATDGAANTAGDASAEAADPDSCTGPTILASSYDQSCASAADCAMVGEGAFCDSECQPCPYAVINTGALAKYQGDVAAAFSGKPPGPPCGVCAPAPFAACCLAGKCHADSQCPSPTDASADAASSPDGASSSDAAPE